MRVEVAGELAIMQILPDLVETVEEEMGEQLGLREIMGSSIGEEEAVVLVEEVAMEEMVVLVLL